MQTNFTLEQLKNPRVAEADSILRKCVHCGFCIATCPTYLLLGDERDSPRGRIYLMKEMFEGGGDATPPVRYHIDRCVSCLSCVTTCPSGVDYMHLVDLARMQIEETAPRSLSSRLIRRLLADTLPYPKTFRLALIGAMVGRYFAGPLRALGFTRLAAMLALAPARGPRPSRFDAPTTIPPDGRRKYRVALLTGCAQQPLRPQINEATVRLLTRHGAEVTIAEGQGCCGALTHHMGMQEEALRFVRNNVDAWTFAMRDKPFDAIIINASGCGTMVKDYAHLLARDAGYADRARQVSGLTLDITEFLAKIGLAVPERLISLKVAYHSACSMQHGQGVNAEPRELLREAGFTLVEVPEGHICCGSAGTYNILQPELAGELRERKLQNIASMHPDVVAAGNIGCIQQLQGSAIPIVHTVELLDWALGGPCPTELTRFKDRVRDLRELAQASAA